MLFFSSVCAMIVTAVVYRTPRKNWPVLLQKVVLELHYNLLAIKEIFFDWVYAGRNKCINAPQTGRVAIITGGSRGIGAKVVRMLMELDMEVIIACRTPSAGHRLIDEIRESGMKKGQARVYKLDNTSLTSVKQFAQEIKKDFKEIHVLINNAGIMFGPYEETENGFEQQWAVNYLSHFLLTALLLPLLKAGGVPGQCSRIVNVTSCAHLLGTINFDDLNHKKEYITGAAYAQSKLAQVVSTKKLQNLLEEKKFNVQVYCVHPGIVFTDLFSHCYVSKYELLFKHILKTPEQGAIPIVYAAINKAVEENGGAYINNCRDSTVNADALNPLIQNRLLEVSLQQVELKDFFQHV